MKKRPKKVSEPREMRAEYDFRGGVRGKHAGRYAAGTNVVVLDPDVAAVFPDAASVNRALRQVAGLPEPPSSSS
jgi:hypothetical protein